MKIALSVLLCLFLGFNAFAQTAKTEEVAIEQISLWRTDGEGNATEETESFLTTDKTLLFRVALNSLKPTTVKLLLVAVNVPGLRRETKSLTVSFTTNGNQNIVNFTAFPEDAWLAGKYRADIFINNKPAAKKEFMIEKPPSSDEKQTVPKTNAKPKTARRTRRN